MEPEKQSKRLATRRELANGSSTFAAGGAGKGRARHSVRAARSAGKVGRVTAWCAPLALPGRVGRVTAWCAPLALPGRVGRVTPCAPFALPERVGRVTPCAPLGLKTNLGAHGVTRPTWSKAASSLRSP